MNKAYKAYLAMTIQCIIIGFSYIVIKVGLDYASPTDMLAHRFTVAFIIMWLIKLAKPEWFPTNRQACIQILPCTILFPVAFFFTQVEGLQYISSSQTGIIYALIPIFTVIVARYLIKETIIFRQWIYMLLSIAGVIYINAMNGSHLVNYSYEGFLWILGSAISFAIYNVLTKKLIRSFAVGTIIYHMMGIGFIGFNIIAIMQHIHAGTLYQYFAPLSNIVYDLCFISLGILASIITTYLGAFSLKTLDSTVVGLLNNLSTIVSVFAGVLIMGNPLFLYHIIGIFLVLAGTVGFTFASKAARLAKEKAQAENKPLIAEDSASK